MRNSLSVHILCAILFIVFSFTYLYCYQADVMVVSQHLASGGKTHYNPLIGAVLITLVLGLLQIGVFALTKLRNRMYALTYLPSLLVLAFLTSIPSDVKDGITFGAWIWAFPLMLVLYAFVAFIAHNYQEIEPLWRSENSLMSQLTWINLSVLLSMFLIVGFIGNHDRDFHYRVKTERYIADKDYVSAYYAALEMDNTNPNSLMLRAYALSCVDSLGEKLFTVPVVAGSNMLAPDGKDIRTLLLPEYAVAKKAKWNVDYVLCKALVDRDHKRFLYILKRYQKPTRPLARHYKEALLLFNHKFGDCGVVFEDEKMVSEFADFLALCHRQDAGRTLKDKYGDTYWYYYICEKA